jgi:hypothetical protein
VPSIEKIYIGQDISYFSFGRDCASVGGNKIATGRRNGLGKLWLPRAVRVQEPGKPAEICQHACGKQGETIVVRHLPYKRLPCRKSVCYVVTSQLFVHFASGDFSEKRDGAAFVANSDFTATK